MSRPSIESLSRCVDLAYAAAIEQDGWPQLLRELGAGVDCHFVGQVTSSIDRRLAEGIAIGVDREEHQTFLRRFHKDSPYRIGIPLVAGGVRESRLIVPRAVLERTEMYQAFHRPHDLGQGLQLTLWLTPHGQQTISLMRSWPRGAFDAAELRWVRALMPHLCRAAQVAKRLRAAAWRAEAAQSSLRAVPFPMLLLHQSGGVVFLNAAAEALIRTADGLSIFHGNLASSHAAASQRLQSVLDAATRPDGVAGSVRLPRPSGKPPLALIAMPLRGAVLDVSLAAEAPSVLVCLSDPAFCDAPPADLLARLFGLTGAEADLAVGLLSGQDLRAIAETTGRSLNTVRNLLARLMAKTETNRQSDLIRLLHGLPLINGASPQS